MNKSGVSSSMINAYMIYLYFKGSFNNTQKKKERKKEKEIAQKNIAQKSQQNMERKFDTKNIGSLQIN